MPRVLIAGCGYVGEAAAKLFLAQNWKVAAWTRSHESAEQLTRRGIAAKAVDVSEPAEVSRSKIEADVVVYCASAKGADYEKIYRRGIENLAHTFSESLLIFTSSTSVYAQQDGSVVTEESAAEPIHENGKILRAAEEIVLASGGIVLRLAGIYGPERSFLLRTVLDQKPVGLPSDRFVNQVHREDIAAAIFLLAQCQDTEPPRIFNVVDNAPTPRPEILEWLSRRLAIPLNQSSVEHLRKRGDSNKKISNAKLRALGWQPFFPSYVEAFEQSIFPAAGIIPIQN